MTPIYSIILPTFNRANLICHAIDSCIDQTVEDWELIIVDNGSTDETAEVITAYDDERIKYHFTQSNGRSAARNYGLNQATGQWICFLDSDDKFEKKHLQVLFDSIKNQPTVSIHKTGVTISDKKGQVLEQTNMYESSTSFRKFLCTTYASIMEVAIRSDLAKSHTFAEIEYWEDKHYLLRISEGQKVIQLPHRTVLAMQHEQRSINKAILETKNINDVLHTMTAYFRKTKDPNENFVKLTFISTLIANGFLSGMQLGEVLKALKKIQTDRKLYYTLKAIYYRYKFG